MREELLRRIVRESGVSDLLDVLGERLAPTDLQSLLLEVASRRAARQTPAGLLDRYAHDRFVRPSTTNPQLFAAFDALAFSLAVPPFEPIELAPVCPLGTSSVVAGVSQYLAVATVRNTEVVSDSTNVLALECAARRKQARRHGGQATARVRVCASHRLLRGQHFNRPGALAHFRAFALCTAGRDEGRLEMESLAEHLRFYVRLMAAAGNIGLRLGGVRVALTPLPAGAPIERLEQDVLAPLAADFPDVQLGFEHQRETGRGYYERLCFHVYARDASGVDHELVDGGFTSWTQALLTDRKERLLISGMGTERVCSVFGGDETQSEVRR